MEVTKHGPWEAAAPRRQRTDMCFSNILGDGNFFLLSYTSLFSVQEVYLVFIPARLVCFAFFPCMEAGRTQGNGPHGMLCLGKG